MSLKSLILLFSTDNLNYFKSNYQPYEVIYQFLNDYSKSSIRAAVSSLLADGDLEKIVRNGTVCFSLTSKGFRSLSRSFLRSYQGLKTQWDGKWRMIVFDIPEKKREQRGRVREILERFGFGRLTNSVYISPFNALELTLEEIKIKVGGEFNLFAFEITRSKGLGDHKIIAKRAFRLDDLAKKYNDWIKKTKDSEGIDMLISYYDTILESDPALPEELLPLDWPFIKSWTIFIGFLKKKRILATEKTGN